MTDVSFIITAYNVENYIAVAVQSAWDTARILEDMSVEILVVDDGSNDATPDILNAIAKTSESPVPLYLHRFSENTPGGVATPSNFGLDHAVGDLVVFIDGDDWVLPEPTANAIRVLRDSGDDMLVTDSAEYWNDTGLYTTWPEADWWEALEASPDENARRAAVLHMAPFPWRKIYRRAFLDTAAIRFPEGDFFFEDNPFHWEAVIKAQRWGWLRQITHIHRRARPGQSLERSDSGYLRIFDHFDTIQALLVATRTEPRHRPDLLDWLIHHIVWVAGRLAPKDWPALFQMVCDRLAALPRDQLWEALYRANAAGRIGPADQRLIHAALQGDWRSFLGQYNPTRSGDPRSQDRG